MELLLLVYKTVELIMLKEKDFFLVWSETQ